MYLYFSYSWEIYAEPKRRQERNSSLCGAANVYLLIFLLMMQLSILGYLPSKKFISLSRFLILVLFDFGS